MLDGRVSSNKAPGVAVGDGAATGQAVLECGAIWHAEAVDALAGVGVGLNEKLLVCDLAGGHGGSPSAI